MLHRAAVDVQFNGAVLVAAHMLSQTVAPSTRMSPPLISTFHILFFAADAGAVIGIALRNPVTEPPLISTFTLTALV